MALLEKASNCQETNFNRGSFMKLHFLFICLITATHIYSMEKAIAQGFPNTITKYETEFLNRPHLKISPAQLVRMRRLAICEGQSTYTMLNNEYFSLGLGAIGLLSTAVSGFNIYTIGTIGIGIILAIFQKNKAHDELRINRNQRFAEVKIIKENNEMTDVEKEFLYRCMV